MRRLITTCALVCAAAGVARGELSTAPAVNVYVADYDRDTCKVLLTAVIQYEVGSYGTCSVKFRQTTENNPPTCTDSLPHDLGHPLAWTSSCWMECPASGIYITYVQVFNTIQRMDTFSRTYYVDWQDLPGDHARPPPNPDDDPDWWEWARQWFTLSETKKQQLVALWERMRELGPFGRAAEVAGQIGSANFEGDQGFPEEWELVLRGPRQYVGQGTEGRQIYHTGKFPLPGADVEFHGPHVADAWTPWRECMTFDHYRSLCRTFSAWVLWLGFSIAFIVWAKGRWSG